MKKNYAKIIEMAKELDKEQYLICGNVESMLAYQKYLLILGKEAEDSELVNNATMGISVCEALLKNDKFYYLMKLHYSKTDKGGEG